MTDVLELLPTHSFRGIPFAVIESSRRHSHTRVGHKLEYRNGEIIELTASGNMVFRYTIPAREDLLPPQYRSWFSRYYSAFWDAYLDRSPGTLVDSLRGEQRVKPLTLVDTVDIQKRDGVSFDVEFEQSPELDDVDTRDQGLGSIIGIISESYAIDRQMAAIPWREDSPEQLTSAEVNWEESDPPEPTINPIDALTGILRQGQLATQRTKSIFQDQARRLRKLEDAIDDQQEGGLSDPDLISLQLSARRTRLQTLKAQQRQESRNQTVQTERLVDNMTVVEAANTYGMTVDEFLELNPSLAKMTVIPRGVRVHYLKGAA